MRWSLFLVVAFALGFGHVARADDIDRHARELDGGSYKVRLSAALWLAKKKDPRAVEALTRALEKDSEATVRLVAAKALRNLLSPRIPADVRSRAFEVLQQAKTHDSDRAVRKRAKRTLKKLADLRAATPTADQTVATSGKRPSAIFVHVGKPTMGKHRAPKGADSALERAVVDALQDNLSKSYFRLGTTSGQLPTQAELQRDNVRGWYVGATVAGLGVKTKGSMVKVTCTVRLRVNPWNGKDANQRLASHDTASVEGSAQVERTNSKREIELAKRECLVAVAGNLSEKRVAPFLKERNPTKRRPSASKQSKVRVSRSRSAP